MVKPLIVSGTIIIIVVAGYLLIAWLRKMASKEKAAEKGWALKGDLNKAQEQHLKALLDTAAEVMRQVATPAANLHEETSLLTPEHRADVEAWLRIYNEKKRKI